MKTIGLFLLFGLFGFLSINTTTTFGSNIVVFETDTLINKPIDTSNTTIIKIKNSDFFVNDANTDESDYKSIIIDGKIVKYKESNNIKTIIYE